MNEFDLIKMIELKKQRDAIGLFAKKGFALDEKIDKLCDCQYPDGTSTWIGGFFGSMCRFCGRHDY